MKKWLAVVLSGLTAAALLTGCSSSTTVELGQYKGVEVTAQSTEVTDEEVDARVQTALVSNPDWAEVDREAKDGDKVNIDYKGSQDGVEFEGGSGEDYDLTLGSNTFIDGFEEGLVGAKKGDVKTLDLTFPEDYKEAALAGEAVTFEVTVNAVKERRDAVLDDAFVQRVSDFSTVQEYEDDLRAQIKAEKERSAELAKQQEALQIVMASSKVTLGSSEVSKRYNEEVKSLEQQAKSYGGSLSTYAAQYGTDVGGFKEMIMADVRNQMTYEAVVDAIFDQEGMTVTDEDRQAYAEANGTGMDYETLKSLQGEEAAEAEVKLYKVAKFLSDNAVEKAPEATASDAAEETSQAAEAQ